MVHSVSCSTLVSCIMEAIKWFFVSNGKRAENNKQNINEDPDISQHFPKASDASDCEFLMIDRQAKTLRGNKRTWFQGPCFVQLLASSRYPDQLQVTETYGVCCNSCGKRNVLHLMDKVVVKFRKNHWPFFIHIWSSENYIKILVCNCVHFQLLLYIQMHLNSHGHYLK